MTKEKQTDDGGNAFPYREQDNNGQYRDHFGLSIRDYFAAAALTGLIQQRLEKGDADRPTEDPIDDGEIGLVYVGSYIAYKGQGDEYEAARDAYKFADAMLAARKESHE